MTTIGLAADSVPSRTASEAEAARRYFGGILAAIARRVDACGKPAAGTGRSRPGTKPRRRTTAVVSLLQRSGLAGKRVVDLGCGDGELSIAAASLGADVLGVDFVEPLVLAGRHAAARAGLASRLHFQVRDITTIDVPPSDVTMLVGVAEYYSDLDALLRTAFSHVRELAIVVDTRGPWWRRTLRRLIARVEGFTLIYRPPALVTSAMARCGFCEAGRIEGPSFTAMAFVPTRRCSD